jgi:hypothetical protein
MFHAALEAATSESVRTGQPPADDFLRGAIAKHIKEWEEDNQGLVNNAEVKDEMIIDSALVFYAIQAYVKHHVEDFNGKKKWLAMEKKFEVPYKGLVLFGYIDALYEEKKEINILETKTKGRINPDMVDLLHTDFQTFYYLHGVFLATGRFPKALIYNITKKYDGRIKVNESAEEFAGRFAADLKIRPEYYFQRIRTCIDRAEYEKWVKDNLDPLLKEFKDWREGKIPDYCNTTQCDGKYGSCDFLQICACNNYQNFIKKTKADKERDMARRKAKEGSDDSKITLK